MFVTRAFRWPTAALVLTLLSASCGDSDGGSSGGDGDGDTSGDGDGDTSGGDGDTSGGDGDTSGGDGDTSGGDGDTSGGDGDTSGGDGDGDGDTGGDKDPEREDVFEGNHAVGVVTLSESHLSGDNPTPSASAVFYPNTLPKPGAPTGGEACYDDIDGCRLARVATCDPACNLADEFCVFDSACQPTCISVCNASCSANEECYFSSPGVADCRPRDTFDAGTITIGGSPQNLTMLPPAPYSYAGDAGSAPYISGAEMSVAASGAGIAGFEAFNVPFTATTVIQTNPSLSTLSMGAVFGPTDLVIGWVPAQDIMDLSGVTMFGTKARSFICPATDADGTATIPRAVLTSAGDGEAPSQVSITLTRTRAAITKGLSTVGTVPNTQVESEGWLEVATTSTETYSFVGCTGGELLCDEDCVDTSSDKDNCGGCGTVCDSTERCSNSKCELNCTGGEKACDGVCVAIQTDPLNCGRCYNECGAGVNCVSGYCEGGGTGGTGGGTGGWTCNPKFQGDGICDCGCGVQDSDCPYPYADLCDECHCPGPNYYCVGEQSWLCAQ